MRASIVLGMLLALNPLGIPVEAANFTLNPMQVVFTPTRKSAVVTLRNVSKESLRFQIRVFTWEQSPRGEMQLGETTDVVFFPQLLELGPGQQRPIRLGIAGTFGDVEKAYRIFFEELPAADVPGAASASGVQMRVKIGLPVFVRPTDRGTALVATRGTRLAEGRVMTRVENSGNSHVIVNSIRVRGLDAAGRTQFIRSVNGWYLLAKHSNEYEIPLQPGDCAAATLAIEAIVERTTVRDRIDGPLTGCR